MVYMYVGAAFCIYFCIYFKTKDRLNPIGLGAAIWLLCAGLASYTPLYDYSLQNNFASETHFAIFIAAIFFSIPAILSNKNYPERIRQNWLKTYIYFTKQYYLLVNFVAILSVAAFLIKFYGVLSEPPLLAVTDAFDLKSRVPEAIPFAHYFEYLIPYVSLVFLFEIKLNIFLTRRRCVLLWVYVTFSLIAISVYKVSRGDLIVLLSGWVLINYYSLMVEGRRVKFKSLILPVFVFLSVIVILGLLRVSSDSRVSTHFEAGGLVFLSQIYTYIAFNFQNLDSLISSDVYHTYVWAVWRFVLKYFYSGDYKELFNITDFEVLFFNAKTFLYYFYYDLGLIGVALYSLVVGSFVQLVHGATYKDIRFLLVMSFLMKAIIFMFFGNYFFGEFIILFPYMFALLIVFFLKLVPRQCGLRGQVQHLK